MASQQGERVHEYTLLSDIAIRKLGNTDMNVSILSLGTSSLGSVFRQAVDEESKQVVREALGCGVNYVDTSPSYGDGKAEEILGAVLPTLPRDSYYVATKVGRYSQNGVQSFDFSAERTLASVDESLARLGLQYVDVIQVHDVEYAENIEQILSETLPALQKVKESGKARYIGITGYPLAPLRDIVERSTVHIDTVLSYCRYTLNDTSLTESIPFFEEKGVGIINASPIAMGLLSERGPPEWHPAGEDIRQQCAKAAHYCHEKNVDIARLALRFALENEKIATTLVSTASKKNVAGNIHTAVTPLTQREKQVLDELLVSFMQPLKGKDWEGKEVIDYRERIGLPHESAGA